MHVVTFTTFFIILSLVFSTVIEPDQKEIFMISSNSSASYSIPVTPYTRVTASAEYGSSRVSTFLRVNAPATEENYDFKLDGPDLFGKYSATIEPDIRPTNISVLFRSNGPAVNVEFIAVTSKVFPKNIQVESSTSQDIKVVLTEQYQYYSINIKKGRALSVLINTMLSDQYSQIKITRDNYNTKPIYLQDAQTHKFNGDIVEEESVQYFIAIKTGEECKSPHIHCQLVYASIGEVSSAYEIGVIMILVCGILLFICLFGIPILIYATWNRYKRNSNKRVVVATPCDEDDDNGLLELQEEEPQEEFSKANNV